MSLDVYLYKEISREFVGCDECRSKPGVFRIGSNDAVYQPLCKGCQRNKDTITELSEALTAIGVEGNRVWFYEANITHNLNKMAQAAGIYEALWRPEEIGATKADDIISILQNGLDSLKARPRHYRQFNNPRGWGMYKHFVPFVESCLNACIKYPMATIEVSR